MSKVILSFNSNSIREKFFNKGCLEKHGINEDTMDTKTDCSVEHPNKKVISNVVSDAKSLNASIYKDCNGVNLKSCSKFEKKNGSICGYCQYCEFE